MVFKSEEEPAAEKNQNNKTDLSIVTVSYNDREVLEVTLDAVFASNMQKYNYEMILVNNASPDGSIDMVREKYLTNPATAAKLVMIESGANVGFGKGNNNGMRVAKGDYILLLNSDTKLEPDNLEIMLDFMKSRPDVGAATCKLVTRNGEIDKPSRRSEPNMKNSFYRLSGLQQLFPKRFGAYNLMNSDPSEESELEALSGAYMMMSRAAYEAVGGFDERFYHYGEDLDLCRMIREAGFKIWWYPKTNCVHYRGQSSKKEPQKNLHSFHNAMWTYYDKWYRKDSNFLIDGVVYCGIWGRYYLKSGLNMLRKEKYVSK
jgi:GT2 family glycosyltransferase